MYQIESDIYVDQSASSLLHSVIEGELEINQFNVLKVGEIFSSLPAFKIIGRIIGASHLVTFEMGNKQFHEVFACYEFHSSGKKLASYGPLGNVHATVELLLWNKVNYSFRSKLYHNQSKAENWLHELENQALEISGKNEPNSIGLTYDFPKNEFSLKPPKTVFVAKNDTIKNQVNIITAHSYPNEQNIVKSEGILEFI